MFFVASASLFGPKKSVSQSVNNTIYAIYAFAIPYLAGARSLSKPADKPGCHELAMPRLSSPMPAPLGGSVLANAV